MHMHMHTAAHAHAHCIPAQVRSEESGTGWQFVYQANRGKAPFFAKLQRSASKARVWVGSFYSAPEAALEVARMLKAEGSARLGKAAEAKRAAKAAKPMGEAEARNLAASEGLTVHGERSRAVPATA
jgi:hypothetical protein